MFWPIFQRPPADFTVIFAVFCPAWGHQLSYPSAQHQEKKQNFFHQSLDILFNPHYLLRRGRYSRGQSVAGFPRTSCHVGGSIFFLTVVGRDLMKRFLFAVAVLMAFCASAAANPVIGFYTGGDPGEGLDFQGQFAYAIDFGSPAAPAPPAGGFTIGNAAFTNWTATPGATNVANMDDSGIFQTGTTTADADLK